MNRNPVNCLAFDIGSSSGRAYLASFQNGVLKMEEMDRFSSQSLETEHGLQWDYPTLLERMRKNFAACGARLNGALDSFGVECCGDDYGLLDADGRLLGLPYNYRDRRTAGTERIVAETMSGAELYSRTGVHFMRHNTLNQLIAERDSRLRLLERAEDMLFLGDLFHYALTGERHVEASGASITQMMNCTTGEWDWEIFDAFGIPRRIGGDIIPAGAHYGTLKAELARACGLHGGVSAITPATHDSASAVIPIPKVEDGDLAYISSGTWSIIGVEIDRPIITDKSLKFNISNSGTALGKTMFTKNIMGLWIIQQCKRIWNQTEPELSFADIVERALQAKPFAAMIDPDDAAFFDAPNLPRAICAYLRETGQKPMDEDDVGGVARIIFESLAMKYRYLFGHMFEASGKRPEKIYIIGGGGNNEIINQFTANVTGREVVVSLPEATAVGNAMMQLYGLGELNGLAQIRETAHRSFPQKRYQPRDEAAWDRQYAQFEALLKARADRSFS